MLWVVEGHAFLGYWRMETALDAIAQVDVSDVVNRLDLGQMGLIETTSVTAGPTPTSFESARRSPYDAHLAGDLGKVLGVVDVWTARHAALFPLPARRRDADGAIQVVEYRPAAHSAPPPSAVHESPSQTSSAAPRVPVPPRVTQWKNALLDLSLRNRLINFSARQAINLAIPGSSLGLVEDLLNAKRPLSLMPSDQVEEIKRARGVQFGHQLPSEVREELLQSKSSVFTDVTTATYATRLRGLAYKAKTITQETGSNNLYLALGSLVWTHERRELRSPLILLPVTLLAKSRQTAYRLDLDESGQSTPNYCLLEKLRQVHGMTVPGLANPVEDQSGIDLDAAFTAMREALAERGLPFRVETTADLAILQFAKFRLWKDLDENWDEFSSNSLVRHLTHTPNDPFTDAPVPTRATIDLDTLATRCPIPADASQLTAVSDAVAGRTFVLEGPPGTGKSQTITNLLVRATAEGRRVLFVAEKRAALDVVKNRLDTVGMGPFSLDLHDKGSKPAAVREQLRLAFDHSVDVDRQGLQARTDEMLSSGRSLTRYAQRLHETNGAGLSLYSATTQLLTLRGDVEALLVPQHLLAPSSSSDINMLRQNLAGLPEVADQARPGSHHPWAFVQIDEASPTLLTEIGRLGTAADQALADLAGVASLSGALSAVTCPQDLDSLAGILKAPQVPLNTLDRTRSAEWRTESARTRQEVHTFVSAAHPGLDVATPDALRLPVADLHAQAQSAAASNWFGRKKRLREVLSQLESGIRPGSVIHPKDVPALTAALVQLQGSVHHLATSAGRVDGVSVPAGWNPLTEGGSDVVASQLEWLQWAGSVVETHSEVTHSFGHELRALVASGMRVDEHVIFSVESLSAALKHVFALTGATQERLDAWRDHSGMLTRWEQTTALRNARDPQLGSLRRWLDLRLALLPLKHLGMPEARELVLSGRLPADEAASAFERGLASVSVAERRSATGLDAFDSTSHERSIGRFRQSSSEVQNLLKVALPDQAMSNRQFASESETGRIGALRRELAKQRRGLGVRSLLEQYGDLITQLTPCVLVSPDSLARFFPARHGLFDIVVFDEASQIRVADAIGAMGRASSVVVVGDSQQMPPTNFAEPSLDFDDDQTEVEMVVADEESILSECVNAAVPRHWLSWHYRSQDESLISFSNVHYYDGRLSSFPAPVSAVSNAGLDGHGISLVRVTGQFHRSGAGKLLRTNPEEAKAVVAEIARRFKAASPGVTPSIGVVTFNQQQRAYIEALIRDSHDERLIDALDNVIDEGLFIKNLENVQGDERDVILFSTGFSANDKGVLPLNFGPLNRGGGERRLNVAVTRSRRQVVVFSSFDPSQLRADETTSVGIKHLRAYLDVAERGPDALPARAVLARTLDRHREEVADALRQRGYHVTTDVGMSEFRVDISVALSSAPKQPVAAILLDSPTWAARKTVGDRDGLPHDVLGRMLRWPLVARVWLPSWLEDPDTVLDGFEGDLRRTVAAGDSAQPTVMVVEAASMESEELPIQESAWPDPLKAAFASDTEGRPNHPQLTRDLASHEVTTAHQSWHVEAALHRRPETVFAAWPATQRGERQVLDNIAFSRFARRQVQTALVEVVEHEGPIHVDRLARLVAASFDLSRVNAARVNSILENLPSEHLKGHEPDVAWPTDVEPSLWIGYRPDPSGTRPIEQVSLREIANSMRALCVANAGMGKDELVREALAVFGFRRLTPGVSARMLKALDFALSSGLLTVDGSFLTAAKASDS